MAKMVPYNVVYRKRQRLIKETALTGAADSKFITLFYRMAIDDGVIDATTLAVLDATSSRFQTVRRAQQNIDVVATNDAVATILDVGSPDNDGVFIGGSGYHTFLFSADMSDQSTMHMYVDGVAVTPTVATYTDDSINWSHTRWCIGATSALVGAQSLEGSLSFFMLDNTYIDLSDASVRGRFIDADGNVQDPGYFAEKWMQKRPLIFTSCRQKAHVNYGTGGDFIMTSMANRTDPGEPPRRGITEARRPISQMEDLYAISGASDIEFIAADNSINSTAGIFPAFGINRYIQAYGSTSNDGVFRTHATTVPTSTKIVLDSSTPVTNESPTARISFHRTGRTIL